MIEFELLDDPAFMQFVGTAEWRVYLILRRYVWRGARHRLGLNDLYWKKQLLASSITRRFIADKLGISKENKISPHLTSLEKQGLIKRERTGRETIFILGEWIDISLQGDKSKRKEWFYLEQQFGGSVASHDDRDDDDPDADGDTDYDSDVESSEEYQSGTSVVPKKGTSRIGSQVRQKSPKRVHQASPKKRSQKSPRRAHYNRERGAEKNTVNGSKKNDENGSLLYQLPKLQQPIDQTEYVTDFITNALGDKKSSRYYYLVAATIPEGQIRQALSEIKHDGGADNPAAVFVHRMEQQAESQLTHTTGR